MYFELSAEKEQGPWYYTFVKDKGYVNFDQAANWAEVLGSWELRSSNAILLGEEL